ncbi:MAG: hypothetical protein QNK04_10730 [Myxococcota bacterium]|nr:hypothetical protein [Myxococcota bacterium]
MLRARREPEIPIKLRARLAERLLAHAGPQVEVAPALEGEGLG